MPWTGTHETSFLNDPSSQIEATDPSKAWVLADGQATFGDKSFYQSEES
jgi:hypothetical protein